MSGCVKPVPGGSVREGNAQRACAKGMRKERARRECIKSVREGNAQRACAKGMREGNAQRSCVKAMHGDPAEEYRFSCGDYETNASTSRKNCP